MIDLKDVREALFQKYIAPTQSHRPNYIGVEIELPIINLQKQAVDFKHVHQITDMFVERFHFHVIGRDDNGWIYAAQDDLTKDILSYDCSYNNLELSFGRASDLGSIYDRFCTYYTFLSKSFAEHNYVLSGLGINPYRIYNHNVPIENGRYRMLFHHLGTYKTYDHFPMFFHKYPTYGTFSSASQVQLDVSYDRLLQTLNTFSRLEPITGLLFSNSVLTEESTELLCARDMFWENSTHGINPHNIGMYECDLHSIEDLSAYIESTSIYCLERNGSYINFPPIGIMDYFSSESVCGEYYQNGEYREINVTPDISDLQYLRTFKFEDLTFRGTIEYRSACTQPISDVLTIAAYYLGLNRKLDSLESLLSSDTIIYHHGYNKSELRKLLIRRTLPAFIDQDRLYHLVFEILRLAEEGLKERGLGEERFLMPLFERAKNRTNPAKHMLDAMDQGTTLEEIILKYSELA